MERTAETVELALREELARGDELVAAARPVLRHLLAAGDRGLFSDERLARIRGMMLDVARQLLFAEAEQAGAADPAAEVAAGEARLADVLLEDGTFLAHALAVTLEAEFAERMRAQGGIDPVVSPLVEELAGDDDAATAELAVSVLAAQARFLQHCRRMELPLRELPGDLFHRALLILRASGGAEAAESRLRAAYDEGGSRLALIARLVLGLAEPERALSIDHAGLAIFTTAVAIGAGQQRDRAVLSLADQQSARLALVLRAAGLEPQAVAEQFLSLGLEAMLPDSIGLIRADRAAALLAAAQAEAGA